MAEENFDIVYRTDATQARPGIDYLRNATIALGEFAASSAEQIRKVGAVATTTSKNLATLGTALDQLAARKASLIDLVLPFEFLDTALKAVRQGLAGANADLRDMADRSKDVGRVTFAVSGLADGATRATANVGALGKQLGQLAADAPKVGQAKAEMVGFQRAAYGAKKNVEETGAALAGVATQAAGLKGASAGFTQLGTGAKGLRGEIDKTTPAVANLGSSMLALQARIAMFNALKDAVASLGKAFTDARETSDAWAKGNLSLRDQYRELANLQGKSEPDDQVVGGALRFRVATGLSDQAANDALRRFEGELPAAKDAGNITGDATSGVAGDFLRETTRTGLRVGLSGATSGLLAAKIAMTEKVPDAATGSGKFQTIVDTLNRGSGDLTPLVNSLVNTAGGLVGKGQAFKSLPELAAAIEVTSANASPTVAGTRVRQANTGLNRLRQAATEGAADKPLDDAWLKGLSDDDRDKWVTGQHGEAKLKSLKAASERHAKKGKPKDEDPYAVFMRDEVRASQKKPRPVDLGLKQDDFVGNIEKLGKHLDGSKDWDAELTNLGLKNQTERRSLIQLVQNRNRLRAETDRANKGVDPKANQAANDKFFAGDTAQLRIAQAKNDAAEFVRARDNEKLQVARKAAESRLKSRLAIDTPATNFDEAMADNATTRLASVAALKAVGKKVPIDAYPIALGGKTTRQLKIDAEALDAAKTEGKRVGIDTDRFLGNLPDDAPFEERYNALATEVQKRGGNPYNGGGPGGGVQTDQLLQQLIREVQRGNNLQEQGLKQGANPGFLPTGPQIAANTISGLFGGFGLPAFDPNGRGG